jgi:hypothetical protein
MATLDDLECINYEIRKYKSVTKEELEDLRIIWGKQYTEEELKSFIDTNKISDIFGCNEDGSNCILKKCPIFKIIESESGNGICNAILDNYILESR